MQGWQTALNPTKQALSTDHSQLGASFAFIPGAFVPQQSVLSYWSDSPEQ
jgi:hypothetical protein